MSDSLRPHRWQPTRLPRPWDSPGENTGVCCHFLLQCMKVKSGSEVTQSCPTLSGPMDHSLAGSSVRGIFQARVLEWGAIAFSEQGTIADIYWFCLSNTPNSFGKVLPTYSLWYQQSIYTLPLLLLLVAQSCPILCNPMDCSTPGFPVLHYLPEFAQMHVHCVSDAIQPSHPLTPSSPTAFNLSTSGSFTVTQFFTSGGQSIGASASASILPMNIQG